jgi:hypothetical protein
LLSPKDCIFRHNCVLNVKDMLELPSLATLLSLRYEWRFRSQHKHLLVKHSHQVLQPLIPYVWYFLIGRWMFISR